MNSFDTQIKDLFAYSFSNGRMPHAVLIEGGNSELRQQATQYLSMYAVCSSEERPCGECKNCIKAQAGGHPDIYTPKLTGKTNIISVDAIRELIKDASIICNESDTKVFILPDVDKSMAEISQNAFLKVLEEPPQSTLFILTADSSKSMLSTILSRVQVFSLKNEDSADEQTTQLAQDIIKGILDLSEAKLLYATAKLSNRQLYKDVLSVVSEYLRQGLSDAVGTQTDSDTAAAISKKLTKSRIIALIEATSSAIIRADHNVNMALLCTWLCGEYRRISWQR